MYLMQSRLDGSFDVGWTTDPVRRLVEHNAGGSRWTSHKRPWRLLGVERQPTRDAAKRYERTLKRSPHKLAIFKKRVLNRAANGRPRQVVG